MLPENETIPAGDTALESTTFRILTFAIVSAFLFALGGVATSAQEFFVWIPHRLASVLILAGLTLGLVAMVRATRVLFGTPALARNLMWRLAWSMFFGVLPPIVFLAWAFCQSRLPGEIL